MSRRLLANYTGRVQWKSAEKQDSDNLVNAQTIIRDFALHSSIQKYPVFLLADSGCPDQTS